jgi:hypothetical protein
MNDVIGFDVRIEKLMPLQGILLSKLRRMSEEPPGRPLTIFLVLVLDFFTPAAERGRRRPRAGNSRVLIVKPEHLSR